MGDEGQQGPDGKNRAGRARAFFSKTWNWKYNGLRLLIEQARRQPEKSDDRTSERVAVRFAVPLLLVGAVTAAILLAACIKPTPDIAFGSPVVFAGQLLLLIFYGALLVAVPVVRALWTGELPVELSLRGGRWLGAIEDTKVLDGRLSARLKKVEELLEKIPVGGAPQQELSPAVRWVLRLQRKQGKALKETHELQKQIRQRIETIERIQKEDRERQAQLSSDTSGAILKLGEGIQQLSQKLSELEGRNHG